MSITHLEHFKKIDAYIHQHRYSKHSFVQLLESGVVTKNALKNWAVQKFHQTYMQNVIHGVIHGKSMYYEDIRQFQVSQLIAEETSIKDGTDAHYNLMKRFALAMGAKETEIKNSSPHSSVFRFVDYLVTICRDYHPVIGMLASYINESQTPESVMKMYHALKKQFQLNDSALEWFLVHGEVDDDHANSAKELIIKYASDCEDFFNCSFERVKQGVAEWTLLQDYYASILKN